MRVLKWSLSVFVLLAHRNRCGSCLLLIDRESALNKHIVIEVATPKSFIRRMEFCTTWNHGRGDVALITGIVIFVPRKEAVIPRNSSQNRGERDCFAIRVSPLQSKLALTGT